mmetsp:Transcript_76601/g.135133  ORF Transcript_76601/g.135133 Transcript_76601/m.135133 type:complete len:692 (-) Transcript_76601:96-2171(-)
MTLASKLACGSQSQLKKRQTDSLQAVVNKHIQDPALRELSSTLTSTERGIHRWEQAHLVSALDVLNAYQKDRKARAFNFSGAAPGCSRSFKDDPRTRMCELLKSWLRSNAGSSSLVEDEVRGVASLCRDLLNHPELFPARNPRSFLRTIADVYDHLQWQLQEVLERDRSCADLAQRVLSLSRNLTSDAIAFLLLAPTDLQQTDALPSTEVVSLWQSLPNEGHPLPSRSDPILQKVMAEAWRTRCGSMVASLLSTPWCLRLFASADADASQLLALQNRYSEGLKADSALRSRIEEARTEFNGSRYKNSALVGALRGSSKVAEREHLFEAALATFDLSFLLGEVMVQFHRISDGLGDYGMIRVSPWLHPFLEAVMEKVQKLKHHLEQLNEKLDDAYVLARARGQGVEKPAPSTRMCARARQAIERALIGRGSHVNQLFQLIDELRIRSAPERLPHVAKGLGDACMALQSVLGSPEFRAHVGDSFPELPNLGGNVSTLAAPARTQSLPDAPVLAIEDREPAQEARRVRFEEIEEVSTRSATPASAEHRNSKRLDTMTSCCTTISSVASPYSPESSPKAPAAATRADVYRLVTSKMLGGYRRHDQRSLEVLDGQLLIYEKGSRMNVKSSIELPGGVERVGMRSETILEIAVSRTPAGASPTCGVSTNKNYIFEFQSAGIMEAFCEELLRQGGASP